MAKTDLEVSVTALIAESIKVNKAILKELREQNRHLRILESKVTPPYYVVDYSQVDYSGTIQIGTKN